MYSDKTGERYTVGELHNFVVNDICSKDPNKEQDNTYVKYKTPINRYGRICAYGFCDIYDKSTHEMWEVKRASLSYDNAVNQLVNYVTNSVFVNREDTEYYVGGTFTTIAPNYFTKRDNDGEGTYHFYYWDDGKGVVYYDYVYIPSAMEAVTSFTVGLIFMGLLGIAGVPIGAFGGMPLPA